MTQKEWNKNLFDSLKANEHEKVRLPEHDNLVDTLSSMQFKGKGKTPRKASGCVSEHLE